MPTTFTITRLRDLRVGDVILSLDGRPYRLFVIQRGLVRLA